MDNNIPDAISSDSVPDWAMEFLAEWKELLFLQEWDIDVRLSDAPGGDKDNHGSCLATSDIRHAAIELNVTIQDDDQWRQTIIHELLHVRLSPLQDFVDLDLIPELSTATQNMVKPMWRRILEPHVHLLAKIISAKIEQAKER